MQDVGKSYGHDPGVLVKLLDPLEDSLAGECAAAAESADC